MSVVRCPELVSGHPFGELHRSASSKPFFSADIFACLGYPPSSDFSRNDSDPLLWHLTGSPSLITGGIWNAHGHDFLLFDGRASNQIRQRSRLRSRPPPNTPTPTHRPVTPQRPLAVCQLNLAMCQRPLAVCQLSLAVCQLSLPVCQRPLMDATAHFENQWFRDQGSRTENWTRSAYDWRKLRVPNSAFSGTEGFQMRCTKNGSVRLICHRTILTALLL